MSWREVVMAGGRTWEAVVEMIDERIKFHERIVRSRASSVEDVRASQAVLEELDRMRMIRKELAEEAAARAR